MIINGLVDSNQSIASYFDGIEPLQTHVIPIPISFHILSIGLYLRLKVKP